MMGSCTNPRTRNPLTENGYPLSNCHSNGNNDDRPSIFQSTLSFKSTVILLYYGCENRAMALFACQPKHAGHWDIYGKYVYVSKYVYIYPAHASKGERVKDYRFLCRSRSSRSSHQQPAAAAAATSSHHTQKLWHREVFTPTGFYMQKFLHREKSLHRSFYAQKLLHRDVFTLRSFCTQTHLHRGVFTHRSFYTESFYTQTRLHTEALTCRRVMARLHTEVFTRRNHEKSLQRSFHTQNLLHTKVFTQKSLHREAFTRKNFYTQKFFYTEKSLHRGAFTRSGKLKLTAIL